MKKEAEKILAKIDELLKMQEKIHAELHELRIELLNMTVEEREAKVYLNDIRLESIFTVEFLAKNEEKRSLITRVSNCLARNGYKCLGDIFESSMADLYHMHNGGVTTTAFILLICEHYGVTLNEGFEKYVQRMGSKTWDKVKKSIEEQKKRLGTINF